MPPCTLQRLVLLLGFLCKAFEAGSFRYHVIIPIY